MLLCDRQLVVTLLLSVVSLGSWVVWQRGSTQLFLRVAVVFVGVYLVLNFVVLGVAPGSSWRDRPRALRRLARQRH